MQTNYEHPLLDAASKGDIDAFRRQLAWSSKSAPQPSVQGNTALHIAAIFGHLDILKEYKDSSLLRVKNKIGQTPAILAALNGHCDVVKYCFDTNPETVLDKDNLGQTPLLAAIEYNHVQVAELCIASDQTLRDPDNHQAKFHARDALFSAAEKETPQYRVIELLLAQNIPLLTTAFVLDNRDPLAHYAARRGDVRLLEFCIQTNPEVLRQKHWHSFYTPAMLCAENGHLEALKACVRQDSRVLRDMGSTVHLYTCALKSNNPELIQFMLESDPKLLIDSPDFIVEAVEHGSADVVEQILDKAPLLLHHRDEFGSTPFYTALCHNRQDLLELFLSRDKGILDHTIEGGRNYAHAAIAFTPELLPFILEHQPSLCRRTFALSVGSKPMIPAHYAASLNKLDSLRACLYADPLSLVELPEQRKAIAEQLNHHQWDFMTVFRPLLQFCFYQLRVEHPSWMLDPKTESTLIEPFLASLDDGEKGLLSLVQMVAFLRDPLDHENQETIANSDNSTMKTIGLVVLIAGLLAVSGVIAATLTPASLLVAQPLLSLTQSLINAHIVTSALAACGMIAVGIGLRFFSDHQAPDSSLKEYVLKANPEVSL